MTDLTDTRILIAGGTGNVGRHLVAAVLAAGGTAGCRPVAHGGEVRGA